MKNNSRKRRLVILLILLIGIVSVVLIESLDYSRIELKRNPKFLRIGYLNLNKTKIAIADLKRMKNYKCDIWLLAEWNGNNFDENLKFESEYQRIFDVRDNFTYGFLVLSKNGLNTKAKEFNQMKRPYKCDYKKILIESENFQIGFLHAPPPVPKCGYETKKYISDAIHDPEFENTNQVLIGDFNITELSNSYKLLANNGYLDVFVNDRLFAGTFGFKPGMLKWLRIDYCFIRGKIVVKSRKRFPTKRSDHCGIIVDLNIIE